MSKKKVEEPIVPKTPKKKYPEGSWRGKDGQEYIKGPNGVPQRIEE